VRLPSAAGGADELRLWDARGRTRHLAAEGSLTGVAFSPDGHRVAASSDDGSVRWWDLPSGAEHPLAHKGDGSHDPQFSHDGARLLAGRGEVVRMWVLPGATPRKLRGPNEEVLRAQFTPDGARVVTTAADGVVRVYLLGSTLLPAETDAPTDEIELRSWLDKVTNAEVP
jgi:WD40 repeat protein